LLSSNDGGALLRVIAGELAGHKGPGSTQTPITIVHATLQPGAQLRLPWNPNYNALAYVLHGHGFVGEEKNPIKTGQLVTYRDGDVIVISADNVQESRSPQMDVLILGGQPIKESVAWMGPFVMNTKAEVLKAFDDFQKGVLGVVPPDWSKAVRPLQRDGAGHKLNGTRPAGDLKGVHNTPDELNVSGQTENPA
jgi:redox-sensitive bicupin YhaK (pirin superfamily)